MLGIMEDWRLTDHTAEAGLSHAAMWRKGAYLALEQARHGEEMFGLWLGVLHFVQCVHHVRKCVEMAAANVESDMAAGIKEILVQFDKAVPHLTIIRDVMEHYEDGYALGIGKRQQPEIQHWLREIDPEKSEEWRAVPFYVHDDMEHPALKVNQFELELVPTLEAAEAMMWSLYDSIRRRDAEDAHDSKIGPS